ncbi:MAG: response regulator transcription factor [Spirochaetaceae bacterium]|jgi:DNA-binding response OmpR family regulator|nr:response regulator transcription factor [Spirochaetaceae bacterium]
MKKVLIVEDNVRVAKLIQSYIKKEGYGTVLAYDGAKALHEFFNNQFDLLILDIMLPEKSGLEIAEEVRKTSSVPIIMITAKSEEEDKLRGLGIGADDYIVKPFSPKEMVARVNALFRRVDFDQSIPAKQTKIIKYKELQLVPDRREVFYKNRQIEMTALQFNLLLIFINSPGQVFTRNMLLERIEAEEEIFERTIDAHIKNIRRAFGESGGKAGIIQTVFGVGYKLE